MKHQQNCIVRILAVFFLVLSLTGCSQKQQKQLPPLEFESDVEYALSFLHAMNSKDTQTIDALLDKEAIIVYEDNPESIFLGFTSNEDSYISYLLASNSRYEEITEERNNLNSIMVSFIYSNKLLEDIWEVGLTTRSKYEFVVENQRITLIYVYHNMEEENIIEEHSAGGVGIEYSIAQDNSKLRITTVYAGTPAAVLGLKEGDLIYSLNGISISSMSMVFNEVQYWMLGKIGTPLIMEVQREGSEKIEELTLTRMALTDYIPLSDEEILSQIEQEENKD